jgi:hypothetical protein
MQANTCAFWAQNPNNVDLSIEPVTMAWKVWKLHGQNFENLIVNI